MAPVAMALLLPFRVARAPVAKPLLVPHVTFPPKAKRKKQQRMLF
jgi:hypothetical protein